MNDLTNRNYFRQSPELINGNFSLSKSEGDLFYAVLTAIDKDDEEFKDYTFTKSQLQKKLDLELNSTQLRATAKSLMRKVFEIYKNEKSWEMMGFSYFKYEDELLTCRFDKNLKPYLLQIKPFVVTDLRHILQIRSEYSRRIYLLLKERYKFGTRKFNIEKLMDMMEVKKSYRQYSNFKREVLNKAVKDINRFTDIEIKNLGTAKKPIYFEEEKFGKKVVEVVFHFKRNHNDLKTFIKSIREFHINEPLFATSDGRVLKCSEKGLLYYADDVMAWIDEKKAMQLWEYLHDNRENLFIYNQNSVEDIIKKLQD